MTTPACHPTLHHYARNLCAACWRRQYQRERYKNESAAKRKKRNEKNRKAQARWRERKRLTNA